MIETLLLFPIIVCPILFLARYKRLNLAAMLAYSLLHLIISTILYLNDGDASIYFKTDKLNILFLLILSSLFLGVSIYSVKFLKSVFSSRRHTSYVVFLMLFVFSMTGVILSTHLGLLWVFVEATTLASTPLVYFHRERSSIEAAWKYIFVCSIGIALAFIGIILLSMGTDGTASLFFEDLYKHANDISPLWLKLSFPFILIGFGVKMGLAPLHNWLPDAHSESPSPISAMLSGTLLNTAFLAILRIYKLLELANKAQYAKILLLIMGFLSLLVSAVFIIKTKNYKRMLAYSSIENMGIIAIGIGIGGIGVYASLLHLIGHSLSKSSLFLTSGTILHYFKTKDIKEVKGLLKHDPVTGWLWILGICSISAFPPFSTFISEFLIVKESFSHDYIILAGCFLFLLTIILYGMAGSVFRMSFGEKIQITPNEGQGILGCLPQIIFLILLFILGVFIPEPINTLLKDAAASLNRI